VRKYSKEGYKVLKTINLTLTLKNEKIVQSKVLEFLSTYLHLVPTSTYTRPLKELYRIYKCIHTIHIYIYIYIYINLYVHK